MKVYRSYRGVVHEVPFDSGEPVDGMIRQLRVRHYSMSTVKTYSIWCRQFLGFCSSRELDPREGFLCRVFVLPCIEAECGFFDTEPGIQRCSLPFQERVGKGARWD